MQSETLIALVRDANPERNVGNLMRRALKMLEEIGETAQSYLAVTSAQSSRKRHSMTFAKRSPTY